ncbi:MAG: hypothetical protein H8D24_05390 [Gammaproteobacteria bacterium]|uniref:Transmembrane protein n=1 Tax=Candidatus Thiopontia autotrophica TaxID=2841688 RepID=A0A8J6NX93_9GAMM|nr:hypothetical protein [Candidatus Thiopontia autotrophica]
MEWWQEISGWFSANEELLFWIGIGSAIMLVASIAALPWLVSRIPEDYFDHTKEPTVAPLKGHPAARFLVHLVRNLIGLVLIIAGILMLFLPGQGLLTLLLGIMMTHFPGKYHVEQWFIRQPGILTAINWFREKGGTAPLIVKEIHDN